MDVDRGLALEGMPPVLAVRAPGWASWVFAITPLVALVSATFSAAVAVLIVPLFDFTPLLVLVVVASTRPWRGVERTWLKIAAGLAVAMVFQWAGAYTVFALYGGSIDAFFGAPAISILNRIWWIYPAQLVLLLLVFGFAAAASLIGIHRAGAQNA
jgi:hypothetical protein